MVRYLSGRAFVWSGKCQFGDVSVGYMAVGSKSVGNWSGPGKVSRVFVWSGSCPSGFGNVSIGEVSVGEMSVGDVSRNRLYVGDAISRR